MKSRIGWHLPVLAMCLSFFSSAYGNGISWPEGQVVPRFSAYASLEIADISGFAFDKKLAITTLQGLVNRSVPRIYILDAQQFGEGKNFWLDKMTVAKVPVADPMTLFRTYRTEITGVCIYDPAIKGTINAAVTAAGVTGCVVASPAMAQILMASPYSIPVSLDLRVKAFKDDLAAFTWAKAEYWSRCSHRMLAGMRPGVHYSLMDYIVANAVFCMWLAPEDSLGRPLLDAVFSELPVNGVYVGWWAGETSGVGYASGFGVMTFATDWFANATVHGGSALDLGSLPEVAGVPKLADKTYIALILSDGDNLQEQEHLFPKRWNSPLRGTFPVSWTQSPAMADFAPALLKYYYSTRTPNDCFLTGPSGVGYVLPEKMSASDFTAFAGMTNAYLKRTGIRAATIWGNSAAASHALGVHCPTLLGLANKQDAVAPRGTRYWNTGLPSVHMTPDYASFGHQANGEIDGLMKNWDRTKPLFVAGQLNANVAGLDELKAIYDTYKDNPEVVFVRADQLFQLMRLANPGPIPILPAVSEAARTESRPGWIRLGNGAYIAPTGVPMDVRGRSYPGLLLQAR